MPDVTIPLTPAGSGVWQYQIPDTSRVLLKAVRGSFDGTAIGAAWFPAVRIIAPGAVTDGEYPTTVSVAAGGSATVDFFPGAEEAATGAASAGATLPLAMASDIDTTITSGGTTVMSLNDFFGTTDASFYSTMIVGGKTYLKFLQSGIYRAQACCIAADAADTGTLALEWFQSAGLGTIDSTEFDGGQQIVVNFTSGGLNRWIVTSDTYFGINNPSSTGLTIRVGGAGLTGNLSTQHTDVILTRIGPYVANVFL